MWYEFCSTVLQDGLEFIHRALDEVGSARSSKSISGTVDDFNCVFPEGRLLKSSDCIRKNPLVEVDAKRKAAHMLLSLSRVFPIGLYPVQ